MSSNVFKRVEKKFLTDEYTLALFLNEIQGYLKEDRYCDYTICNLYYDTQDNLLIRRSIEKPIYKEKLRLRSYGIPSKKDKVFIEKKMKFDGTVYKRRIKVSAQEAVTYLSGKTPPPVNSQIGMEIDYFLHAYTLHPKLFIAYDRKAYSCIDDDGLRITIDKNIRSRQQDLSLMSGDHGVHLLPRDKRLIEIKTGQAFPLWLANALNRYKIYPVSFSKYGNIYKENFNKKQAILTNDISDFIQLSQLQEVI